MSIQVTPPKLYLSAPHECPYLADKTATMMLVDPDYKINSNLYSLLIRNGFRRSGNMVYRPHCRNCKSCVSSRILVPDFTPNRAQKRVLKRNADIYVTMVPAQFQEEHFMLYRRYQSWRHFGDLMDNDDEEHYIDSIVASPVETVFLEFRQSYPKGRLLAVAVCDVLDNGLSAVYAFYHDEMRQRSLGTFAILKQVEYVANNKEQWVYLGYWVQQCRKMAYKENFRPLFGYIDDQWRLLRS